VDCLLGSSSIHESLISSKLSETVQCLGRGIPTSFHIQVSVMGPANLKEGFLLRLAFMHTVVRSGQIRLGLWSIDVSVSELFKFLSSTGSTNQDHTVSVKRT
jgi:hypothetical protein